MPNIKSAAKRMRQSEKRRAANRSEKRSLTTVRVQLLEAFSGDDRAKIEQLFRQYCSGLDRAVKHGTIKANNASRRKSRMAARLVKA